VMLFNVMVMGMNDHVKVLWIIFSVLDVSCCADLCELASNVLLGYWCSHFTVLFSTC